MKPFENVSDLVAFIETSKRFIPKINLDKMHYLCDLFDNPQKRFPSIHVTGTNGKGSVVANLKAVFQAAEFRVGTFTSPYITCFNERIMINKAMISDEDLLKLGNRIIAKYDEMERQGKELPTFFEFTTLLAFLYFSERPDLDLAIIEVGIGGKLDSTNVIEPLLSIISNVNYDHQNVLGNTLEEILAQKLGIVKHQVPLVTGIQDAELLKQCLDYCKKTHSAFFPIDYSSIKILKSDLNGTAFVHPELGTVEIVLPGFHQIENALIAIEALKVFNQGLFRKLKRKKFPLSHEILLRGLKQTKWPGRLEVMSHNPLVVIDGAHNVDGIYRVTEFIQSLPYERKRVIFACSHDKDKQAMIDILDQAFEEILFTAYTYKRHNDVEELFQLSNHPHKRIVNDVKETIEIVWKDPYEINLFIGSLYFVSEIRPLILQKIQNN
ncbi:MAG: bifunctional folylpolyglutamate synthase/dihydrofolate synthase [Bacilli bacterium]|jgi:dihydrofolate synthase/folylpolyglutamate synthase|nr:bifunctional folylpolyglutamate synthase/dihydrofolate synthase [Bacilli bacterium]